MIKLRLKRFGKKREASYRIVAINSRDRREGRPLEELGFYNPRTDEVRLDRDGILRRLEQGAQPTDTVRDILVRENILPPLPHRKAFQAAAATAVAAAPAPAAAAVAEVPAEEAPVEAEEAPVEAAAAAETEEAPVEAAAVAEAEPTES